MNAVGAVLGSSATTEATQSWLEFAGLLLAIAAAGKLIDWLCRKKHKNEILDRLSSMEGRLTRVSVAEWQRKIASGGLAAWTRISGVPKLLFDWVSGLVDRQAEGRPALQVPVLLLMLLGAIWFVGAVTSGPWPVQAFTPVALVAGLFFVALVGLWPLGFAQELWSAPIFGLALSVAALSSVWSGIALALGLNASALGVEYLIGEVLGDMSRVEVATAVNLPFDAITVFITAGLLRYAVTRGRGFAVVAAIDVLASVVLTFVLAVVVEAAVLGSDNPADHAVSWVADLVSLNALDERHAFLTPLLLTTFVPVALYMSTFVLLGLVVSPALRVAAYLSGLLSEKKNTPFFELAVAIGLVAAAIKGVATWLG